MSIEHYIKVAQFIDYENDLLDAREYEQWLTLWQDDGMYIVPVELTKDDYANQLNYAYDDATMRRMRVARLNSGESVSVATNGGTVRLVSRLRVIKAEGEYIEARCALLLTENRRGNYKQFVANVEYQLIEDGDTYRIKQKVVKLINAESHLSAMSYIL